MVLAHNIDNVKKFQTKAGKAIEQFLNEKGKKSENTARSYRTYIERYLDGVYEKSINTITFEELDCLDYDSFTDYVNSIEDVSNSTVNSNMSAIKSLTKYLKGRDLLKSDISFLDLVMLMPKDSKRIAHMTKEVVMKYIDEAGKELHNNKEKQKVIMFAVDTALRLEDYIEMEWSQFTPQEDYVALRGYGKGNKPWMEKISYKVYNELLELKKNQDVGESRVFAPLSAKNVTQMMIRLKKSLGYDDISYSFHSFKKTAVTFAYRLTGDMLEAMKKGKHSNMETTRIYLEEEDYGITGMFSVGDHDPDLYKKVSPEVLMAALESLNKDTLHLLNIKINNIQNKNN